MGIQIVQKFTDEMNNITEVDTSGDETVRENDFDIKNGLNWWNLPSELLLNSILDNSLWQPLQIIGYADE